MEQSFFTQFFKELAKIPGKKTERKIWHVPHIHYFNPQPGLIGEDFPKEEINADELEAIRLKDLEGKSQIEGADLMHISQTTFHRLLLSAHGKIARALIEGKSIQLVIGTNPMFKYGYGCMKCDYEYFPKMEIAKDDKKALPLEGMICQNPACASSAIYRLVRQVGEPELKNAAECPNDQ